MEKSDAHPMLMPDAAKTVTLENSLYVLIKAMNAKEKQVDT